MEGLGATLAKDANDMLRTLCGGEARNFMQSVATGAIPTYKLRVNAARVCERVISLCVGDIDFFPRRQGEDPSVKAIGIEQASKFGTWHGRRFVHHGDRLYGTPIEEDPLATDLPLVELLDIAAQDCLGKREWLWPR